MQSYSILFSEQIKRVCRAGGGGVLDHESRGKKILLPIMYMENIVFTIKINPFHVLRRKTHSNSATRV